MQQTCNFKLAAHRQLRGALRQPVCQGAAAGVWQFTCGKAMPQYNEPPSFCLRLGASIESLKTRPGGKSASFLATYTAPKACMRTGSTQGDLVANGGLGAGLITNSSDPSYARIDYNAAAPRSYPLLKIKGYAMKYHTCGDVVFDVRWNVQTFTSSTRIITVAARQSGATTQNILIFAPPVNLRTVQGP